MGNSESIPSELSQPNRKFVQQGDISPDLFRGGTAPQQNGTEAPRHLTLLPANLTQGVSLYQEVDVSFNHIPDVPLDLPLRLPHLESLNLSHNRLRTLPGSMFGFLHLHTLDVSHNQLESLPDTFFRLEQLVKLDLSYNQLKNLSEHVVGLANLRKLNIGHNNLEALPEGLANLDKLEVLLANKNSFSARLREVADTGDSQALIQFVKSTRSAARYKSRKKVENEFGRERGPVFDSRVLNAGSAQSLFSQMQAQAVQTGNRLLTPMIPPVSATTLDAERLRDALLGMFFGAFIGDSMGVLTDFMTPSEAEFHYRKEGLQQSDLHLDEHRCRFRPGDITLASRMIVILLESIIKWSGVVDELDYTARLAAWLSSHGSLVTSRVLQALSRDLDALGLQPTAAAEALLKEDAAMLDSFCLPAAVSVCVTQFHDLAEVGANSTRICLATHAHKSCQAAATAYAQLLACLLQGRPVDESIAVSKSSSLPKRQSEEKREQQAADNCDDTNDPLECIDEVYHALGVCQESGFRHALTEVVMKGGNSSVNGCVCGAAMGLITGYRRLPTLWLNNLSPQIRKQVDKKLNHLFDLMGIP